MKTEAPTEENPIDAKDYYTVMIHFYRGELGRIMIWRQRLDVTTNWAIVGATAMVIFGLGEAGHTPLIFIFANLLVFLLLTIEARRYRFYDAFRARVRMLETHFIMPVMMRDANLLQGDWKKVMSEDLMLPSFKMSRLRSVLKRFRRNYVWIFLIVEGAWFVKIWLHYPESHSFAGFLDAFARHHLIPTGVFWVLFGMICLVLFSLVTASFVMKEQSGEFSSRPMRRRRWMK